MASARRSFSPVFSLTAAALLFLVLVAAAPSSADAQMTRLQRSRGSQVGSANANANANPIAVSRRNATPAVLVRCFAANCAKCNNFNPYVCAQCNPGYQLTAAFSCNSCAPGYEQNLDVQTFTCTACPSGYWSNGGTGQASQCYKLTTTSGRRLFEQADVDDLWA
jgi:hypothetical protein